MNLNSFADELIRLRPHGLTKQASILRRRPDRLYERLAVGGGLAGLGGHTLESAKAGLTANPYDTPQGTYLGALKRGALGGLLAALGLKTLGKMSRRGHPRVR
jgi:hypothetical protein